MLETPVEIERVQWEGGKESADFRFTVCINPATRTFSGTMAFCLSYPQHSQGWHRLCPLPLCGESHDDGACGVNPVSCPLVLMCRGLQGFLGHRLPTLTAEKSSANQDSGHPPSLGGNLPAPFVLDSQEAYVEMNCGGRPSIRHSLPSKAFLHAYHVSVTSLSEAGDSRKDILAARTGNVTECQAKEAGWGTGEADTRPFRRRGVGPSSAPSGLRLDGVWLLFNSSTDTCLVPQAEDPPQEM